MTQRGSSQDSRSRANAQAGQESDPIDLLYEAMNSPRQRRALAALSEITVEDLRENYQPGETETGPRD